MISDNSSVLGLKYAVPQQIDLGSSLGLSSVVTLSGNNNSPQLSSIQLIPSSISMTLSDPAIGQSYIRAIIPASFDNASDLLARNLGDLSISITDHYNAVSINTATYTLPLDAYTAHRGASSASYALEGRGDIVPRNQEFIMPDNMLSKVEYSTATTRKLTVGFLPNKLNNILPGDYTTYSGSSWLLTSVQLSLAVSVQYLTFYFEEIL